VVEISDHIETETFFNDLVMIINRFDDIYTCFDFYNKYINVNLKGLEIDYRVFSVFSDGNVADNSDYAKRTIKKKYRGPVMARKLKNVKSIRNILENNGFDNFHNPYSEYMDKRR